MSEKVKERKKAKVRKPHPILHGICLAVTAFLLVSVVIFNGIAMRMSGLIDLYARGISTDATEEELEAARDKSREVARQTVAEGTVLLRNEENTLPLSEDVKQVNVFGWASTQWLGGGSGSGRITSCDIGILEALSTAGIEYNKALEEMYRDFQGNRPFAELDVGTLNSYPEEACRLYEPDISDTSCYTEELLADAEAYSDTALVVFSRYAGESSDCPQIQYKKNTKDGEIVIDETRTYLDLSVEEENLLKYVGEHFDHVIVLLNTGNVMTVGQIETLPGIDACLMAGFTGQYAAEAIPDILWGKVSPSGRTADTWAYDFTTAASYANAAAGGVGSYTDAEGLYPADGTTSPNVGEELFYDQVSYVDYAEGIYIGYKWYETADAEGFWNEVSNEYGTGYDGVVQYPFGYGLSYTDFDWKIVSAPEDGTALEKDGELTVEVEVTNTGSVPGKDVVELYYTAPYLTDGIEKSEVELAAFAKTEELAPGESETLTVSFRTEDMASYDYNDANKNGFAGYELDEGTYTLSLRRDAHTVDDAEGSVISLTAKENYQYPTDSTTGNEVSNKFTGEDAIDGVSLDGNNSGQDIQYMTRSDFEGTFPRDHVESRPMSDNVAELNLYTEEDAKEWINEDDMKIVTGAKNGLKIEEDGEITELGRQLGADPDDPQWESLLDQLTVSEMENLFLHAYLTTAAVDSVGKPLTHEADGPSQIGSFNQTPTGTGFPSAVAMAQTWDTSLALDMGRAVGTEAAQLGYSGWYAPAANMHRSPFNGRNYEYYSEDSLLTGLMCGSTVAGSLDAGTYCYVKHFICNDQESGIYRDSIYTWMTEQTLRETYLEPFRIMVEDYGTTGLMTAYNRIGAVWAGGSEALLTGVLRDEWGFTGAVITDYCDHHQYMNGDQALRAGGSLWMDGLWCDGAFTCETGSDSYLQELRRASKDVLYMYLNARVENENYVQEMEDEELLRPVMTWNPPFWKIGLAVIDVVVLLLFALSVRGIVRDIRIYRAGKREKKN